MQAQSYRKVTFNMESGSFASLELYGNKERAELYGAGSRTALKDLRNYLETDIKPKGYWIVEQREGKGELYSDNPELYLAPDYQFDVSEMTHINGWRKRK